MNPAVESVLYSIVASIICDIGKYGLGQLKYKKVNFEKEDVEKYVFEKIDKKYELLCDSGIVSTFASIYLFWRLSDKKSTISDSSKYLLFPFLFIPLLDNFTSNFPVIT